MLKDHTDVVPSHQIVWDNQWFTVKQTSQGFTYGERRGVNSIAFMLVSKDKNDNKPYGVVKEYKNPIEQFVVTAFGGSIDTPRYKNDLEYLVQEEVIEESGFRVDKDDIWYLDKVLVSTQMNQFCHLFVVYIDKSKQGRKTTTNKAELLAQVLWLNADGIIGLQDWKAPVILSKKIQLGI